MTTKPVVPRALANRDVDGAIDWYLANGGTAVALAFIDELERAYTHLGRHPASGSARYGLALSLPDLRAWPLKQYPYLIFYVESSDQIEIWRVLHAEQDVPAWLRAD